MFKFIININTLIEEFYYHLKDTSFKRLFSVCIFTGFLSGLILGTLSFLERTSAYGLDLTLFKKFLSLIFSVTSVGILGLTLSVIEFLMLAFLLVVFLKLTSLTKKDNKLYPYKTIILLSLIAGAISSFLYIKLFVDAPNELFVQLLLVDYVFVNIFNFLFIVVAIIAIFLIYIIVKMVLKKDVLPSNIPKNKSIIGFFTIIIILLALYYFYSIFSSSWQINSWLNKFFYVPTDSIWNDFLAFYSNNTFVFKINLFLTLSAVCLLIAYVSFFIITKLLKLKYFLLVVSACSFMLFIFMYFFAQNIFTNQLFFKFKTSIIIIVIAIGAFILLHLTVLLLYQYFSKMFNINFLSNLNKKNLSCFVIAYIILLVIGNMGFNGSNAIKSFICRHCTYEKMVLYWPILFNFSPQVPTIPSEMSATNKNYQANLKQAGLKTTPNIFLITVDALRYDVAKNSISDKGSALYEFTQESYNFTNNYSNSAFTVASISSLFTSKLLASRSDIDYTTLAQILSKNGYLTYSLNNFNNSYEFDSLIFKGKKYPSLFSKGFQVNVKTDVNTYKLIKDYAITQKFTGFLKHHNKKVPVFAYIHLSELHWIQSTIIFNNILSGKNFLETYKKVFASENDNLKKLFEELKKLDLYDNSLIIITSDHGESAKEHGDLFHIFALYQENVHIPLLIKFPNATTKKTIDKPISLLSLTPTILDFMGYDCSHLNLDGHSLVPLLKDPNIMTDAVVLVTHMYKELKTFHYSIYGSETYDKSIVEVSVIDSNNEWKVIYNLFYGFKELYNLKSDPAERNNLIDENIQKADQMLQQFSPHLLIPDNKQKR